MADLHGQYDWSCPLRSVYYGPGCLSTTLPKLLDRLNVKAAMIVTGQSLFSKTDVVKKVEAVLKHHSAFVGTFYDIGQHSPIANIRNGVQSLRNCGADAIVSIGGGSPIDAAKVMIHLRLQDNGGAMLTHIAIPTTLSAAEFSIVGGYSDQTGSKVTICDPQIIPAAIIMDAELTLATPERLWLSTGMRALCPEILNRPLVPPPVKHLCYAALADLFKYLPECKANPEAVSVRQKLQLVAWMSYWPINIEYKGIGLSHTLGHKLGATYHIPHGITSCLTLAPVVALKAQVATEEDKEWLAGALFHLREPSTGSLDSDVFKLSGLIIDRVASRLVAELGLTSTLKEYNVPRSDPPNIAERALGSRADSVYPRVVTLLEGLYAT
ncbi:alcohol dehydrogenase IV [Wolfiporia cocos MD-104 SS10]|uniref:Alcohol dehydrogenase IV n=1 Tax=Wolfiporia cocos (strain MD-104) TaxID=742152 RepID=A0A2H3JMQ6_WOLCO|nr:alcohol dehydrogenase IV [Wolfiporia cocos MD-104 SS10]